MHYRVTPTAVWLHGSARRCCMVVYKCNVLLSLRVVVQQYCCDHALYAAVALHINPFVLTVLFKQQTVSSII